MQSLQLCVLYNENPVTTRVKFGIPILNTSKWERVGLSLLNPQDGFLPNLRTAEMCEVGQNL